MLITFWPTAASAQRRGGPRGGRAHAVVFVGGYFYDPFYGPYPWWGPYDYPYAYYPVYDSRAELRMLVTPKEAGVYVDGFYAGNVDDFDGFFQRLPVSPGDHEIALYLQGYRTVRQSVHLARGSTVKIEQTMDRLPPGEASEPPPEAPAVPAPPSGSAIPPRSPRAGGQLFPVPPANRAPRVSGGGTVAIRVQPSDAEISIDGERWNNAAGSEPLIVQVTEGRHHLDISRNGYGSFAIDVTVREGETTPVNVSLSPQGPR